MNLIIDIGNTLTKLFVFDQNKIIYSKQSINGIEIIDNEFHNQRFNLQNSIISSVIEIPQNLHDKIENLVENLIILSASTKIPIKNLYKTPETLGKDRLAAIVGAYNIFPNKNVLAIDAGTAITFDFINENAEYLGGNISPGLNMRFRALNHFTGKLPLVEANENFSLIGTSTEQAIISGVQNGIIFEINAYIDRFLSEYEDVKVILTGGDTFFFAHKLNCAIFAEPFLVAIGLNRILQNNVKKN